MSNGKIGRAVRRFRKERRGAVVAEFGLVFPVMMLIVFATIDFSRAFYTLNNLSSAVREGARFGAVLSGPDTSATQQAAIKATVRRFSYAFGGDSLTNSDITVDLSNINVNGQVIVTVNYTFTPITPLVNVAGLASIPLQQTAVFRWERAP